MLVNLTSLVSKAHFDLSYSYYTRSQKSHEPVDNMSQQKSDPFKVPCSQLTAMFFVFAMYTIRYAITSFRQVQTRPVVTPELIVHALFASHLVWSIRTFEFHVTSVDLIYATAIRAFPLVGSAFICGWIFR